MELDRDRRLLTHGGRVALLTRAEFAIVDLLISRPGFVRSRENMIEVCYSHDQDGPLDDRAMDSHVKRIRRKMRALSGSAAWIATRYGDGYAWADEQAQRQGLGGRAGCSRQQLVR